MKTQTTPLLWALALLVLFSAPNLASAYYDPGVQRWINRDPVGSLGGDNLHGFCHNSPINRIDPNGRVSLPVVIGVGGVVVVAACTDAILCRMHMNDIREQATVAANDIMEGLDPRYNRERDGPDREGSPADALRHCIGACMANQHPGACLSSAFVRYRIQRRDRGPGLGHAMDRANNEAGFSFSGDCRQSCINAARAGRLQCFNPGDTRLSPCRLPGGR